MEKASLEDFAQLFEDDCKGERAYEAEHEQIAAEPALDYYFTHPYAAWECGTNENTNGLLRQYFPKKSTSNRFPNRPSTTP